MTHYRERMLIVARCGVILMLYGVSASMALLSIGKVMAIIFWLLSLEWSRSWHKLKNLPAFWPLILIPVMVITGSIYSIAPLDYAYRYFTVYSRLLIVLIIISLINDEKWQFRCWIAFFTGAFFTLASTYAGVWFKLPWSKSEGTGLGVNHNVFYDYIAQGVMTSFLAVVSLSYLLTEKEPRRRIFWLVALMLSVFSITHLIPGRTGQVVCLVALTGIIIAALPKRQAIRASALIFSLGALFSITSPVLLDRFSLLLTEVQLYKQGELITSIGMRLAMWSHSIGFFMDQPLWGHGTGSYRLLTEKIFTDPVMCMFSCVHPHNQFLFFGVEHGLPGICLYAWFLFSIFRVSKQLKKRHNLILIGLLIIITVDSFINTPFWITGQRNFYVATLGLTLAAFYLNPKSATNRSGT
jgi:O-antigen ligase